MVLWLITTPSSDHPRGKLFLPSCRFLSAKAAIAGADASQNLKPIKADSYEIGLRGMASAGINYEVSAYHMTKSDDVSLATKIQSPTFRLQPMPEKHCTAGSKSALAPNLPSLWRLLHGIFLRQTYPMKTGKLAALIGSGYEMEAAPRHRREHPSDLWQYPDRTGSIRVAALWWLVVGSSQHLKYEGHELFQSSWSIPAATMNLFANIHNLTDKRYAESTGVTSGFDTFRRACHVVSQSESKPSGKQPHH